MRIVEPSGWRPLLGAGSAALIVAVLGSSLALGQDRRESEAELSAVRKEIKQLQDRIARETTRRDESTRALRAAEVDVAAATRKLAQIRGDLKAQEAARLDLERQSERASRSLAAERDALARQVRSSYMAGREELTKLLLSQQSPAALGRMLVYFDYYNRARSQRIAAVAGDLAKLEELEAATARVEADLTTLEAAQRRELAALEKSREERRAIVAKLDAGIRDGAAAVSKLRAEEQRLADLVQRLSEVMAGFPDDTEEPFAQSKGKLAWPVQGRIAGDYGQVRGADPSSGTAFCSKPPPARRFGPCIAAASRSRIGCKAWAFSSSSIT